MSRLAPSQGDVCVCGKINALTPSNEQLCLFLSPSLPPPVLLLSLSMVNKAAVDYFFVELRVEKHFEALRHFLLMEDGEFALSLTDRIFEKVRAETSNGSGA